MKAPVAVRLGRDDIVFFLQKPDIVLPDQHVRQPVNIVGEGADHPDPRDVIQLLLNLLHGQRIAPALHFLYDADRPFQPALYGFKGISVIGQGEFLIQHPQLGLHLHHGAAIAAHQLHERLGALQDLFRMLRLREAVDQGGFRLPAFLFPPPVFQFFFLCFHLYLQDSSFPFIRFIIPQYVPKKKSGRNSYS